MENLTSLDAPLDGDLTPSERYVVRTQAEIDADREKELAPKPEPKEDTEALIERIISRLPQPQTVVQQLAQPANQPTPLEREIERMKAEGIPEEAIRNAIRLNQAAAAEALAVAQQQGQQQAVVAFTNRVTSLADEALAEVAAGVKPIANSQKLREELLERMGQLVANDPSFRAIKNSIDSFKEPNKNQLKALAAKVSDDWCAENGITKPQKGLDLKSSKTDASASARFDINSLTKVQRMVYEANLKHLGDAKLAQKRALETNR